MLNFPNTVTKKDVKLPLHKQKHTLKALQCPKADNRQLQTFFSINGNSGVSETDGS